MEDDQSHQVTASQPRGSSPKASTPPWRDKVQDLDSLLEGNLQKDLARCVYRQIDSLTIPSLVNAFESRTTRPPDQLLNVEPHMGDASEEVADLFDFAAYSSLFEV